MFTCEKNQMNEISVLMYLLSKRSSQHNLGATREEIMEMLNPGKNVEDFVFNKLISKLSNYIEPLGLRINYNPINSHWYLSVKNEISELFKANPFIEHPSLAATLFIILTCSLRNRGTTTIQEARELRKKKNLMKDLKDLEKQGYISIDSLTNRINLTPLIGYQIDMEKLYRNILLRMKDEME